MPLLRVANGVNAGATRGMATSEVERLRAALAAEFAVTVAYDGADLSKAEEVARLVATTRNRLGGVDVLVNNAGIQFVAPVEEFPDERWEAIIALNLSAVFYAMKAAIPSMKENQWGRIINVASAHGLVASANKIAYVAAKHGVVGATKVAALELANEGVTVNAICPGWVLTPLVESQLRDRAEYAGTELADEKAKLLEEKQPMAKFTTPEAIGTMALFLCTDEAQTVTGTALSIDGGWTAQ